MHYVLIHAPGRAIDTGRTQNVGYDFEEVVAALAALAALDGPGHTHEILDGTTLHDESRQSDARLAISISPLKKKGRKIGNSFGTNSQPFQDFGTDIPVLLVYDDGRCVDVYPHVEHEGTVTITKYLTRVPV